MPSLTRTGVLQVMSPKQNYLAYGSETTSGFHLLDLSDGLVSGVNSFALTPYPNLPPIIFNRFIVLSSPMRPPSTHGDPSGPATKMHSRATSTPPTRGGGNLPTNPQGSLVLVPLPAPRTIRNALQIVT